MCKKGLAWRQSVHAASRSAISQDAGSLRRSAACSGGGRARCATWACGAVLVHALPTCGRRGARRAGLRGKQGRECFCPWTNLPLAAALRPPALLGTPHRRSAPSLDPSGAGQECPGGAPGAAALWRAAQVPVRRGAALATWQCPLLRPCSRHAAWCYVPSVPSALTRAPCCALAGPTAKAPPCSTAPLPHSQSSCLTSRPPRLCTPSPWSLGR